MRLWQCCQTQWRTSGFGLVGLDYPAVERMADLLVPRVRMTGVVLAKLQQLEAYELRMQQKRDRKRRKRDG